MSNDPDRSNLRYTETKIHPYAGAVESVYTLLVTDKECKCIQCGLVTGSDPALPMYKETESQYNQYYCGCCGFD